jgi:hypothetical protein
MKNEIHWRCNLARNSAPTERGDASVNRDECVWTCGQSQLSVKVAVPVPSRGSQSRAAASAVQVQAGASGGGPVGGR